MLRREIRRGGVGTRKVAGVSRGCAGIHLLVASEQSWEGSSWVNRSVWEKAEGCRAETAYVPSSESCRETGRMWGRPGEGRLRGSELSRGAWRVAVFHRIENT